MVNNKVIWTYKRKRFSQSRPAGGAKPPDLSPKPPVETTSRILSQKSELGTHDEKLKGYSCCFHGDDIGADRNMLSCESCSKTCLIQCTDSAEKYTAKEKWRCSTCQGINNFGESMEDQAQSSKRARKSQSYQESETGSMNSHKMLSSIKPAEGSSKKKISSAADSSVNKSKIPIQMGSSSANSSPGSKSTDMDSVRNPASGCVDSSEIKCSSRIEDSFMMTLNSDKTSCQLGNDAHPKEDCGTPLITFCRRVKKTHSKHEKSVENNLKTSVTESSHAVGVSASTAVSLEQAKMANFEKNNGSESTPAGGSDDTKMTGDEHEELPSYNAHELTGSKPLPSQHALDVPSSEDPPDKFLTVFETDILKRPEQESSSKPSINLMESQRSSDPSCAVLALAEEKDGKGKELAWLENLDKVLQDKKKVKGTCKLMGRSDINCGQASDGGSSFIPTKSTIWTSSDQGKVALTKLGDPLCTQQNGDSPNRSLYRNSFGPSSHPSSGAPAYSANDFVNPLLPSSLEVNDNIPMLNRVLPWNGLPETSSSQVYKHSVEDVINRSRMLTRRYSDEWSEEELDYLWVGVRRHGIGNWNAMLRDLRLQFLESRSAEDLAMQWDVEQRKVSNRALLHTLNLSKVHHHSAPNHSSSVSVWPHSGSQFPTAETRLSFGDSYPRTRNFLHSSGLGTTSAPRGESSSTNSFLGSFSMDSAYPKAGLGHQKSFPIRYQWRASASLQKPSEIPMHNLQPAGTSSTLPHWLQDALTNRAPVSNESTVSPFSSANPHFTSQVNYSEAPAPPSDSRGRGVLKMKSVGSGKKSSSVRISELPSSHSADAVPNLNKKYSAPIAPSDLVVLDSDVSSEETISDDEK